MTQLTIEQAKVKLYEAMDRLEPGSYWLHQKTETGYIVISLGLQEADLTPVVMYTSVDFGALPMSITWVRPVSEFLDGRFKRITKSTGE